MPQSQKTRLTRLLAPALLALLTALALASCGGEEPAAQEETSSSSSAGEQREQPSDADGGGSASSESAAGESETDASVEETPGEGAAGTSSCPDVVVTPNSGDGLFEIRVDGISCQEATAALKAWGESGYQGDPGGFSCEETAASAGSPVAELRCVQRGSGATVEFETGV